MHEQSLHLCIVSDTAPPTINGVNTIMLQMIKCAIAKSFRVSVLVPNAKEIVLPNDVQTFAMPSFPLPIYPEFRCSIPSRRRIRKLYEKEKFDHVHFLTPFTLARQVSSCLETQIKSASFMTDFAAVGRFHGPLVKSFSSLMTPAMRSFYRKMSFVFCQSKLMRSRLEKLGVKEILQGQQGVDSYRFNPDNANSELLSNKTEMNPYSLYCLFVGRHSHEKNPLFMSQLASRLPDVAFVMVGEGPLYPKMKFNKQENLYLLGRVDDEELRQLYASCDLFIFPSLEDASACTPLEAMASGTPVLALNDSGFEHLLEHEINGFFCKNLEDSLSKISQISRDRKKLVGMGARAQVAVTKNAWEEIFEVLMTRISKKQTCKTNCKQFPD